MNTTRRTNAALLPTIEAISEMGGRENNEDAHGSWQDGQSACCVVADGAGGHGGGEVASRIVVDTVLADIAQAVPAEAPLSASRLVRMLLHANEEILEAQESGAPLRDMRSTAALLMLDGVRGTAIWAHCGDSRLYCLRGGEIIARTRDHSMVQSMIDARLISPEEALRHPKRSVLYAALGTEGDLAIDPCTQPLRLQSGDAFLLCTDGLWEFVDDARLTELLRRSATPRQWLQALAAEVNQGAPDSHDNFTAVTVWVGTPEITVLIR